MCGRYIRSGDKQKLAEHFHAQPNPTELAMPDIFTGAELSRYVLCYLAETNRSRDGYALASSSGTGLFLTPSRPLRSMAFTAALPL